jgi:hypothetical protein
VFKKNEDGSISRVGRDWFGPGDRYLGVFGFFEFLPPDEEGQWFMPDGEANVAAAS